MAQLKPYEKKEYVQSDSVNQAQQNLQNHQTTKPGDYVSKWEKPMGDLFGQIQNRGPFQFDINKDALYQQMVDRYVQQGQQAMMDTVGQVSALTGGYGNSYAQTAGQQTYQGYLQALADQVPKYQGMALDRYQAEGDDMARRYAMMAQQEQLDYGRHNDSMDRYYAELARLQGIADREKEFDYNSFWQNQNFDYNSYQNALEQQYREERDAAEDKRYQDQWQHQLDRDKIKDQQWQTEFDEDKRRWEIQLQMQREAAARASSRGGGGSRGGGSRNTGGGDKKPHVDLDSVLGLGMGPISGGTLAGLVESGKVDTRVEGDRIIVSNKPAPPNPFPHPLPTFKPSNPGRNPFPGVPIIGTGPSSPYKPPKRRK